VLSRSDGIGGYLELELPRGQGLYYHNAIRYQSARAAFYALLLHVKPSKVWMPKYICDTILTPLSLLQIEVGFYELRSDFSIKSKISLNPKELILYVNYFGICSDNQFEILKNFNSDQIVFDHSQAFFQKPLDCLATIYSPRKFFGIPDGGLLVTDCDIEEPREVDTGSVNRSIHLLQRLQSGARSGYEAYQTAEKSLQDLSPRRMSFLTERMLLAIDYESIRIQRNNNFLYYQELFSEDNILDTEPLTFDGPLCYPLILSNHIDRVGLAKHNFFIPTYWNDCSPRISSGSFEEKLMQNMLPLPCDQRYTPSSLKDLSDYLMENLNE